MLNRILASFTLAAAGALASSVSAEEITAKGSDSTMPLVKALAEAYQKATGNTVKLEGGGSGKGAEACAGGSVQLCFLSRDLKDSEKQAGLQGVMYGMDGAAIVVNKANPVDNVSVDQLRDILSGKTEQWPDGKPVVVFNRNEDSGTRELIQHVVLKDAKFTDKAQIKHDGVLLSSVAKIPTAVGFTSAGDTNDTVKVVKVDGVAPTPQTIRDKSYPLYKPLVFATKGQPAPAVKAFIDFCAGDAGQKLIAQHHYVPVLESANGTAVASGEQTKSN